MLIIKLLLILSITVHSGWASYYEKSPTDHTIQARLDMGHIPEKKYDAYIAVSDCSRIGEHGMIIIGKQEPITYMVFDCAGKDAYEDGESWMVRYGFEAELGYYTVEQYGPCLCRTWVSLFPSNAINQVLYGGGYNDEQIQSIQSSQALVAQVRRTDYR